MNKYLRNEKKSRYSPASFADPGKKWFLLDNPVILFLTKTPNSLESYIFLSFKYFCGWQNGPPSAAGL
jgi:hypothetical protein